MVEGVATKQYWRQASRAGNKALAKLSRPARRCLELAEEAARARNDNHVGTEHIALGLLAGSSGVAGALSEIGITRAGFEAQLFDEPGTSPEGPIPLTPRSLQILGFALEEATSRGSEAIEPLHVLLGLIDESEHWRSLRPDGPHHSPRPRRRWV